MHSQFVPDEALSREAVALAARFLQEAQHHMTRQEKRQAAKIAGMLADPHGKTMAMVVKRADFHSAIAYFVRRLDENTAPENFLHDLFGLVVGSALWHKQQTLFLHALKQMDTVSDQPQRTQNRLTEAGHFDPGAPFANEPDTDWSLPHHQAWIRALRDTWQQAEIAPIPLQVGGELLYPDGQETRLGAGYDPSRPEAIAYRYTLATREHIEHALDVAQRAKMTWAHTPISARHSLG